MKKNMGNIDKVIRILVALVIAVLYFMHVINGTVAIIGLILAAVFILTSFVSFCRSCSRARSFTSPVRKSWLGLSISCLITSLFSR